MQRFPTTVPVANLQRLALSLLLSLFWTLLASAATAQIPDTTHLTAVRADRLTGLYELDGERLVYILDLRDQLDGQPTLSMIEYDSGRVRALYPLPSGAFEAGNAWFRRDSVEYRVRFDESVPRNGKAVSFTWDEEGRLLQGRRVPLREQEITVESGDVKLAGTLVLPPGEGPHPAVVMIPGSGPLTRRAPRYVGDLLAAYGVAVLAMDKRGTGGSTGQWRGLSHVEWATDVETQLDVLRGHSAIDSTRLGLFASSEGGFVAPLVANRRNDVRFLVCRVCSAFPHSTVILNDTDGRLRRQGLTEDDVQRGVELLRRVMRFATARTDYDSLVAFANAGTGTKWRNVFPHSTIPAPDADYWDRYRGLLEVDPRRYYRRLNIPVLVLLGEKDNHLPVKKHRMAFRTVAAQGTDLTLWTVPNATHGLLFTEEGLGPTQYPEGLHHRIARWVAAQAGVE